MITRQQIRAVLADGGQMVDPAGHRVGRIVNVILGVRTSQPAWVTVDCHLCTGVEVVVPLARARLLDGSVQVPYTAADVCGAPRARVSAGSLDPRQAEQLRRYYAVPDDDAPAWPQRLADQAITAVPAPRPAGPGTAVVAPNGHRSINGASHGPHTMNSSLGVLAFSPGLDVLPVSPELDVRIEMESPAAYPATSSGPWPPLSTSSPGPPWWQRRQWRWPSIPPSIRTMRLQLRPVLDMTGLPDDELEDLVLAAGEAATNAVEHARLPTLPVFDVLTEVGEDRARIVIQDHGRWQAPTAGGARGRGLQMMGVLADATLTIGSRGTTVVLRNRRAVSR